MSCINCPPADYILRQRIQNWLNSGYDANKVAALLGCSLDLIADVQANGIGTYTPVEPIAITVEEVTVLEETEEVTEEATDEDE
jgi:hypothetical protein